MLSLVAPVASGSVCHQFGLPPNISYDALSSSCLWMKDCDGFNVDGTISSMGICGLRLADTESVCVRERGGDGGLW